MTCNDVMFIEMHAYLDLSGMRPLVCVKYIDMQNDMRVVNKFPILDVEQYKDSFNQGKYFHGQRVDGKLTRGHMYQINGFFCDPENYSV